MLAACKRRALLSEDYIKRTELMLCPFYDSSEVLLPSVGFGGSFAIRSLSCKYRIHDRDQEDREKHRHKNQTHP